MARRICPCCDRRFEQQVLFCPHDGEATVALPTSLGERLIGATLDGRWAVERELGEGGMGAVFAGRQIRLDRPVAIKVLQPAAAQREDIVSRFLREGRLLGKLRHPNIVTILDFGRDPDHELLYLVMELVEGVALADWTLRRTMVDLDAVLSVVEQIARALVAAHEQGIIHRDLKPQNVMVQPVAGGLHVQVLDFGIAKIVTSEGESSTTAEGRGPLTNTGAAIGTPAYMAPEQCRGGEVGFATDLYALGVILYELLTGAPPFDAPSPMAVMMQHVHQAPPPLPQRWAIQDEPDDRLLDLCDRLLSKDPLARPADALETLELLAALRRGAAPPSRPDAQAMALKDTAAYPSATGGSTATTSPLPPAAARPDRRPALAVATLLVLLLAAGAVSLFANGPAEDNLPATSPGAPVSAPAVAPQAPSPASAATAPAPAEVSPAATKAPDLGSVEDASGAAPGQVAAETAPPASPDEEAPVASDEPAPRPRPRPARSKKAARRDTKTAEPAPDEEVATDDILEELRKMRRGPQ